MELNQHLKKYKFYQILAILLTIIPMMIGVYLIYQLHFLILEDRPTTIQLNFTSDSTTVKKIITDHSYDNIQENINDSVDKAFSSTLDNLNFTITIFSVSFGAFAILIGFLSFSRIKEIKELIDAMEKAPETLMNSYYTKQINLLTMSIFNKNNFERGNAIRLLVSNPSLNESHYDLIFSAIERELDYPGNPEYYINFSYLMTLLLKLDFDRASNDLFDLFEREQKDYLRVTQLISYLVTFKSKHREKIKTHIKNENTAIGNLFVINLINTDSLDEDFVKYILIETNEDKFTQFIYLLKSYNQRIKLVDVEKSLLSKEKFTEREFTTVYATSKDGINFSSKLLGIITAVYLLSCDDYNTISYSFIEMLKTNNSDVFLESFFGRLESAKFEKIKKDNITKKFPELDKEPFNKYWAKIFI